jgi:phage shock protein C
MSCGSGHKRRGRRRNRRGDRFDIELEMRRGQTPPPLNPGFADDGPHGLYRSRDGVILGVCAGLANYLDISVFWTRVLAVVALFMTGLWPVVILYVVAAMLINPEPVVPFREESDMEFYDSFVNSRSMALHRLKRTYEALDRRIRRMEGIVTARDYDWEQRLND